MFFVYEMEIHVLRECLILNPKLDLLSTNQEVKQQKPSYCSVCDRKRGMSFTGEEYQSNVSS